MPFLILSGCYNLLQIEVNHEKEAAKSKEIAQNVLKRRLKNTQQKRQECAPARRLAFVEMACFHPLKAWQSPTGGPLAFKPSSVATESLEIACGQCIGCRVQRAAEWACRCSHEASMHDENCFITLTYDDDHAPWDGSLNKQHFQNFMKRLRFQERGKTIRYFHCGEYGENFKRPHYHALLFGHDFQDKELFRVNNGLPTWTSESLQRLWPFGFSVVGRVTWETAAYCARYTTKKITGKDAKEHYWRILDDNMEVELQPEYATMSLKPAIGKTWFTEYRGDCYPSDFITEKGKKFRVPKYYDELLNQEDPELLEKLKTKRKEEARKHHANNTPKRLAIREECAKARLDMKQRILER